MQPMVGSKSPCRISKLPGSATLDFTRNSTDAAFGSLELNSPGLTRLVERRPGGRHSLNTSGALDAPVEVNALDGVNAIGVRSWPVADYHSLDPPGLKLPTLLGLRTLRGELRQHLLTKGDQALGERPSSHTLARGQPICTFSHYAAHPSAVLSTPAY